MNTVYLIFLSTVVLAACDKDENLNENYQDYSVSWKIGSDHSTDTTLILPASSAIENFLTVSNYSICANQALKITVTYDDQILLDTIYQEGDSKYSLEDSKGKALNVHSQLVAGDSTIVCIWLGQATLKYEYVE